MKSIFIFPCSVRILAAVSFALPFWLMAPVKAQTAAPSATPYAGIPQPVLQKPGLFNPLPRVVMGPDGKDKAQSMRELFENPDQWAETRKHINAIMFADHAFRPAYNTDAELTKWFKLLKEWNLALELEVGAIKEWGVTGKGTFDRQRLHWDRIVRLGGKIDCISMDEPLIAVRHHLKPTPPNADEYAVQETANFIAEVRKHFPDTKIIEIETYPSVTLEEHKWWIDALQKRLADMNVRGLDGYRVDVNWTRLFLHSKGNWVEVAKVQEFCRSRNLPFSLIYWTPYYGNVRELNIADSKTWYVGLMQMGYEYAAVTQSRHSEMSREIKKNDYGRGPGPDQAVIESWVKSSVPTLPESDPFSFTRSTLDFVKKFILNEGQDPVPTPTPTPTPKPVVPGA